MKKLCFFVLCFLLIANSAFAVSVSEAVKWKFPECNFMTVQSDPNDPSPSPKMVIKNWVCQEPQPSQSEVDEIVYEYGTSQDYFRAKFDVKVFFGRLIQVISPYRWMDLSKLGVGWTMQQLIEYPNFEGLKAYENALLTDGTISQDDLKNINDVLAEQGVVL